MSESPETEDEIPMGLAELSVRSVLEKGWESVEIQQTGPDGSQIIGVLLFYVCPVCRAVCPPPTEAHPFTAEHAGFHIKQGRDFDALNAVIDILKGMTSE